MPLDPQIEARLQILAAAGFPSFATLTPEEARLFDVPSRLVELVAGVEDQTIPGHSIPVRIYRPVSEGVLPALIYYHGGGWVTGSIDSYDGICRMLANRANCVVISVDYRLAPEYKFPVAVEDSYAAAQWVSSCATQLRVDPARIAVGGDSAGANLASVVAYLAREHGGPQLVYQVLLYPATCLAGETNSRKMRANGPTLTKQELDWFISHYLSSSEDRTNPLASPLLIGNFEGLPPALVITAEYDPFLDEGRAYADCLRSAGVAVSYTEYKGMVHGFIDFALDIDQGMTAIRQIANGLQLAFEGSRQPTQMEDHSSESLDDSCPFT